MSAPTLLTVDSAGIALVEDAPGTFSVQCVACGRRATFTASAPEAGVDALRFALVCADALVALEHAPGCGTQARGVIS